MSFSGLYNIQGGSTPRSNPFKAPLLTARFDHFIEIVVQFHCLSLLKLVSKRPVSIPFDTLSVLSGLTLRQPSNGRRKRSQKFYRQPSKLQINIYHQNQILLFNFRTRGGGGARLSEISYTYDPPIYDITSGYRVAALFCRETPKWTPDATWFPRYFHPQANGITYMSSMPRMLRRYIAGLSSKCHDQTKKIS